MNQSQIASTIAYTLQDTMTQEQRALIAAAFANDLRLTGKRRERFLNECRTYSEQQEHEARLAEVESWANSVGMTTSPGTSYSPVIARASTGYTR